MVERISGRETVVDLGLAIGRGGGADLTKKGLHTRVKNLFCFGYIHNQ